MSLRSTATIHEVVVGQTAAIDLFLRDDGQIPQGTLAGTIDLFLADIDGNQIDFSGNCSIVDASTWKIRISPDATDFATVGNYRGRIRVTDGTGKIAFFPNGTWDIWRVRSVV